MIDTARLANDLAEADAAVATAQAQLASAQREDKRYHTLADVVAPQEVDIRHSAVEEARARHAQALASRERARINLERAKVVAPVNGIVTNFSLRPGAYATAGQPVMALLDRDSFYVSGYFEETKLARMHAGMRAQVRIMGEDRPLRGHVEGVSAGIEDRERTTAPGTLLANVNPTFSWIRLAAARAGEDCPGRRAARVTLVAGRTVTVSIEEGASTIREQKAPRNEGHIRGGARSSIVRLHGGRPRLHAAGRTSGAHGYVRGRWFRCAFRRSIAAPLVAPV
ncbi:HlyD family secretion protein [Cupriavidus pinatubonensis]|uniref:HlyD family secretion protein n=1 Tax=Cupriavidus pinatubonensis TaxID=248026 RepID=UPI003144FE73